MSVEFDITTECNRGCEYCPSSRGPNAMKLDMAILERFFRSLEGQTKGLLMSGGEPTIAETFPHTLQLAKKSGFVDISLVSNGSQLYRKRVRDALLSDASVIRISVYGWESGQPDEEFKQVLKQVEKLRKEIEDSGSSLEIGFSLLTHSSMIDRIPAILETIRDAGAHWLYFHPECDGWGTGVLNQFAQDGVIAKIKKIQKRYDSFATYLCEERYHKDPLAFDRYHTSYFLMVIGAYAGIYLGTEGKYQPHLKMGKLTEEWKTDDLWDEKRCNKIVATNSDNYTAIDGRHRGVLYNHLVQQIISGTLELDGTIKKAHDTGMRYPYVL